MEKHAGEKSYAPMGSAIITYVVLAKSTSLFEDYLSMTAMGKGPYAIKCTMWREGNKAILLIFAGTWIHRLSHVRIELFYLTRR